MHVDPGAGWFPHFLGFADETGGGRPTATCRSPRAPATSRGSTPSPSWPPGREPAAPQALVVALGVDAAAGDPESPLQVSPDGYRAAGQALGELRLPTVVVQEGGYDLATIGPLVREALTGLELGR